MKRCSPALLAAVLAFLALADPQSAVATESSRAPEITFYVYYQHDEGWLVDRPGVEVSRIGMDGRLVLGTTDAKGEFTAKKEDLFAPGALAVLFCDPQFKEICAAIRLDSDQLREFAEFNVHLPRFALINRLTAPADGSGKAGQQEDAPDEARKEGIQ